MKIFITGATGYIGQELIKKLVFQGASIVALCRPGSDRSGIIHPRVHIAEGDLFTHAEIVKGMKGCDQVYHLAAYARVWSRDKSIYHKVNVEGTKNILDHALSAGVRKMVFTSTAGVLGPAVDANSPVDERTTRLQPFFNEYEETKWQAEQLCLEFSQKGLPVVIVNPSRVYGPGAETESNAISKLITLFLRGKWRFIPGDGKSVGSYVYVDDVVNGHIAAMTKGRAGHRYILGGENVSYENFFMLINRMTGINRKLYHLPFPLMMAFSRFESLKANMLGIRPLITPEWVKKYLYHWPLSSQKAIDELGYRITPLEQGLGKTIVHLERNVSE